jgi:hypothetical protein
VLDHLSEDFGHIVCFPNENIDVVLEREVVSLSSYFDSRLCVQSRAASRIIRVDSDGLILFTTLDRRLYMCLWFYRHCSGGLDTTFTLG